MNWGTVPAILKGYFDKILIPGFAFTQQENFENGLLKVYVIFYNTYHFSNGMYFQTDLWDSRCQADLLTLINIQFDEESLIHVFRLLHTWVFDRP